MTSTQDPIFCQTKNCEGDLTDQEALDSLREYGRAICGACRAEQSFHEHIDRQVEADLDRRAGG